MVRLEALGEPAYLDIDEAQRRYVIGVTLSSPLDDDEVLEVPGAELNGLRVTMPTFGEWTPLLEASALIVVDRFGVDSIPAAIALAHASAPSNVRGEADATDSGWRVPAGDRDLMKAIDNVIDALPARRGIPVLPRGAASILPLAVQADLEGSGRDPHEERRRMRDSAANVGAALEYRERRSPSTSGVAPTIASLALHVVPASWVSTRRAKAASDGVDVRWSIADVDTPDSLA